MTKNCKYRFEDRWASRILRNFPTNTQMVLFLLAELTVFPQNVLQFFLNEWF